MNATKNFVVEECKKTLAAIPLLGAMDDNGKRQIVDTLMENCQSNEHVTQVLKTFATTVLDWKNPIATLVAIAHQSEVHDAPPPGCNRCGLGEDTETGEQRWQAHVIADRQIHKLGCLRVKGCDCAVVEVAVRCVCRRGRWLHASDIRRRDAAAMAPQKTQPTRFDGRSDAEALDGKAAASQARL